MRGTIQRIQIDDQMLTAAHPVVLAPSGVAASQNDGAHLGNWRYSSARIGGSSEPIIRCEATL